MHEDYGNSQVCTKHTHREIKRLVGETGENEEQNKSKSDKKGRRNMYISDPSSLDSMVHDKEKWLLLV